MSAASLFSAGFAWDGVADDATPIATPPPAPTPARSATVSHDAATVFATPSTSGFAWDDGAVAGVEAGAARRDVSQAPVAAGATPDATPKTVDFRPFATLGGASVADVASVANWSEGVATLSRGRCPDGLTPETWREIQLDARLVLQNWGTDLLALGWSTLDVFGVNRDPRHRRLDIPGLVYVLHGRPVEAIDRDTALIRATKTDTLTFHRRLVADGGVPVWSWVGGER